MRLSANSIWFLLLLLFATHCIEAQAMPLKIKRYLDRKYSSWNLSPSVKECTANVNNGVVAGDFNGDRRRDFEVKITQGNKGFILAFLRVGTDFKPFVLHHYDAEEAKFSGLGIWKRGEVFEYNDKSFRLKHDAPSDYHCESDVGRIHYYQNGKFVGY